MVSFSCFPLRYLLTHFSTELNPLGLISPVYFVVWKGLREMNELEVCESLTAAEVLIPSLASDALLGRGTSLRREENLWLFCKDSNVPYQLQFQSSPTLVQFTLGLQFESKFLVLLPPYQHTPEVKYILTKRLLCGCVCTGYTAKGELWDPRGVYRLSDRKRINKLWPETMTETTHNPATSCTLPFELRKFLYISSHADLIVFLL
jgi:hypothetical protein